MPKSMTAFARGQIQAQWGSLTCEIRSVNHRYLEMNFRLPDTLRAIEMSLREVLKKQLQRGKVECNLRLQTEVANTMDLQINDQLLEQVIGVAKHVETKLERKGNLNALNLMQWPGVLSQPETDESAIQKVAASLFQETLTELTATREREGAELQKLIEQRLTAMTAQVDFVQQKMPQALQQQRQRITEKFAELNLQLDADRLEQEMLLYVQKADVEEELDRLTTHIAEVQRILNSSGPIGRKLDFLMQELNREANTLASKSIDSEITQAAVELKVLIEQMREQIQNIE